MTTILITDEDYARHAMTGGRLGPLQVDGPKGKGVYIT
ncbi:hypothetical protein STBA_01480 [Streptomyces sp. MP131-18]|nr:hypothetical protein STBA_01480 [Streptomyces sp. MP131-18]